MIGRKGKKNRTKNSIFDIFFFMECSFEQWIIDLII